MYRQFARIDGCHPFRQAVPDGFVDYAARRRRGGEVVYFNFALGREMGLIARGHPDRMNARLRRAILDTFCLTIINEYDVDNSVSIPEGDRLRRRYMATRYLQLQHPGRTGRTSGDGRSVWNGTYSGRGVTWDISSCGTGVTRLCPATAETSRHYKTGNGGASYGCGTATLEEGLSAALMSETFHANGINTERVLAVIRLADGFAINVRAGRNLLRPSHFLVHSKQRNLRSLKGAADLFIQRQIDNGDWPRLRPRQARYEFMADEIARTFARVAATFESEYIFCWLDWDGDNILADGGIVDYGSVRQFGLFHREYRFDDGPRWSTTITEQRKKCRLIVQNFAQVRDYLITGDRPPLRSLAGDRVLRLFDREFERARLDLLLRNIGFDPQTRETMIKQDRAQIERFRGAHAYFERAKAARGPVRLEDGLTWNAIFSTRDLLRELPERYLREGFPVTAKTFIEIASSTFASRADRRLTPHRVRMVSAFQNSYRSLIECASKRAGRSVPQLLADLAERSARINRYARITGDAAIHAAKTLIRNRRRLSGDRLYAIISRFVEDQTRFPERRVFRGGRPLRQPDAKRVFNRLLDLLEECEYGL